MGELQSLGGDYFVSPEQIAWILLNFSTMAMSIFLTTIHFVCPMYSWRAAHFCQTLQWQRLHVLEHCCLVSLCLLFLSLFAFGLSAGSGRHLILWTHEKYSKLRYSSSRRGMYVSTHVSMFWCVLKVLLYFFPVCMSVCMYVRMYVRMWMCVHTDADTNTRPQTRTHAHMHTRSRACALIILRLLMPLHEHTIRAHQKHAIVWHSSPRQDICMIRSWCSCKHKYTTPWNKHTNHSDCPYSISRHGLYAFALCFFHTLLQLSVRIRWEDFSLAKHVRCSKSLTFCSQSLQLSLESTEKTSASGLTRWERSAWCGASFAYVCLLADI